MSDNDLTTAYMVGFHKRDDEVAALKAEIERLRQSRLPDEVVDIKVVIELRAENERLRKDVIHWREARRSCIQAGDMMKAEIERLRQKTLVQSEAIEALRDLLRGWRDAAEIAQDITFAPIAKETDEKLPGLRWSLRF